MKGANGKIAPIFLSLIPTPLCSSRLIVNDKTNITQVPNPPITTYCQKPNRETFGPRCHSVLKTFCGAVLCPVTYAYCDPYFYRCRIWFFTIVLHNKMPFTYTCAPVFGRIIHIFKNVANYRLMGMRTRHDLRIEFFLWCQLPIKSTFSQRSVWIIFTFYVTDYVAKWIKKKQENEPAVC